MSALMTVSDDWLSDRTTVSTLTVGAATTSSYTCDPALLQWWPHWMSPVYVSSPARPVKLTFREVERLRTAAKGDEKLKAILLKFTPLIEVEMSFEE